MGEGSKALQEKKHYSLGVGSTALYTQMSVAMQVAMLVNNSNTACGLQL
jgi:hypothetical protein